MPPKRPARTAEAADRRASKPPTVQLVAELVTALSPAVEREHRRDPVSLDQDFCLILADFGIDGRAFLGTDEGDATFARAVRDIVEREVEDVVAVIQFNPAKGEARDVTQDVARAVSGRVLSAGNYPHESLRRFLDAYGLAYPPSLEDRVFQRWLEPAEASRDISARSGRTKRAKKAPQKQPAVTAKSKGGKTARSAKTKGRKAKSSASRK